MSLDSSISRQTATHNETLSVNNSMTLTRLMVIDKTLCDSI